MCCDYPIGELRLDTWSCMDQALGLTKKIVFRVTF